MNSLTIKGSIFFIKTTSKYYFKGVLFVNQDTEGSNIDLISNSERVYQSGVEDDWDFTNLSLEGSIKTLTYLAEDKNIFIKLNKSINGVVEATVKTSVFNEKFSFTGTSLDVNSVSWDIDMVANISSTISLSKLRPKQEVLTTRGVGKRLDLDLTSFSNCPPGASVIPPKCLNNKKVRLFWKVQVQKEGQLASMNIVLTKTFSRKRKREQKKKCLKKTELEPTESIETDLLGKTVRSVSFQESTIVKDFPPVALYSDYSPIDLEQPNYFGKSTAFSCVIDNLEEGSYSASIVVRLLHDTENYLPVVEYFDPIKIFPPPKPPTNLSVLLKKTKFNEIGNESLIYEPFAIVSWKPKCDKTHDCGPIDYFKISLEVFIKNEKSWKCFGEETIVNHSSINSTDKESCCLVALPEVKEDSSSIYSKFRVSIVSSSKFGESEAVSSSEMNIPTYSVVTNKAVDFKEIQESDCVICAENILFEKELKYPHFSIFAKRVMLTTPLDDIVNVSDKMLKCPVSPTCCSHLFHLKCLLDWSKVSRKSTRRDFGKGKKYPKCPLCMQEFKNVISQNLDPNCQNERQLFSASAEVRSAPYPFQSRESFYYTIGVKNASFPISLE